MPARRIKTLAAAKARGLPQRLHREHRSKKGREKDYRWKKAIKYKTPYMKLKRREEGEVEKAHQIALDQFEKREDLS